VAALVPPRQGAWGAPERQDQLGRQVQVSEGHRGRRRRPDQLDKSPVRTTWWVNQELRNRQRAPQGQPGLQALPQAVRRQDQVQVSEGHPGRRRPPDQLDKLPVRTTWWVNQELRNRHRAPQGQPGRQVLPQAVRRGWLPATATLPLCRQEPDQLGPPELLMVWRQGCKAPTRVIPQPSQEQLKAALVSRSTELRL
jgi:hypothetical protein